MTKFHDEEAEELVREFNAFMILARHSNILNLFGWAYINYIPAMVTEMADIDLLEQFTIFLNKSIYYFIWFLFFAVVLGDHIYSETKTNENKNLARHTLLKQGFTISKF